MLVYEMLQIAHHKKYKPMKITSRNHPNCSHYLQRLHRENINIKQK